MEKVKQEIIDKLKINPADALADILIVLNSTKEKQFDEICKMIVHELGWTYLISLAESKDDDLVEYFTSITNILFNNSDICLSALNTDQFVKTCPILMKHDNPDVRRVVLKSLTFASNDIKILKSDFVLEILVNGMFDGEILVFQEVQKVLIQITQNLEAQKYIFQESKLMDRILQSMSKNSIIRFRIFESFISLVNSKESAEYIVKGGILDMFYQEILSTNDVLDLANLFEILKLVCKSVHLRDSLEKDSIVSKLIQKHFIQSKDELAISFLLRLLIDLSLIGGGFEVKLANKTFDSLFENLDLTDGRMVELTLSTIGSLVAHSKDSLDLMIKMPLSKYVQFVDSSDNEHLVSILHSIGIILESKVISSNDLSELYTLLDASCDKLFGKPLVTFLMKYARNPFPDQRIGSFHFMHGLAKHSWGVSILCKYPNFTTYILDRDTEQFKELKEWKFVIIESMLTVCRSHPGLLDVKEVQGLKVYLLRGPFYVESESQVDIESETK